MSSIPQFDNFFSDETVKQVSLVCRNRVLAGADSPRQSDYLRSQDDLIGCIAQVLLHNLQSGRVHRVLGVTWGEHVEFDDEEQCVEKSMARLVALVAFEEYVDRVLKYYLQEHQRVQALANRDSVAWDNLIQLLTRRAKNKLIMTWHFSASRAQEDAKDFALQASEDIYAARFPFDTAFDAWVTVILNNRILQEFRRTRDLFHHPEELLSLDAPPPGGEDPTFSLAELLADPSQVPFEKIELQEWLLQAIATLNSETQQEVILGIYFYEQSTAELGQQLNKTQGAIRSLHFNALRHLRLQSGIMKRTMDS